MKLLLIILLLLPLACLGQDDNSPSDSLYYKAANALEDSNLHDAIIYSKIFLKKYHHSEHILQAMCIAGDAYQAKKNYDSALYYYKAILSSNKKPYPSTLKSHVASYCAKIFITKKDYTTALSYLEMEKHKYAYNSFCGNDMVASGQSMAMDYAECYKSLNQYQKAIDELEPDMLPNLFTDDNLLADSLYALYPKVYSKEFIRDEFTKAVNSIQAHKSPYDTMNHFISDEAEITVFNRKLEFYPLINYYTLRPDTVTNEFMKRSAIEYFKKSHIYKLATQ